MKVKAAPGISVVGWTMQMMLMRPPRTRMMTMKQIDSAPRLQQKLVLRGMWELIIHHHPAESSGIEKERERESKNKTINNNTQQQGRRRRRIQIPDSQ